LNLPVLLNELQLACRYRGRGLSVIKPAAQPVSSINAYILLIVWGIAVTGCVWWAAVQLQRAHSVFYAILVILLVAPAASVSCYAYRLHLRTIENAEKHATQMTHLFNSTLSALALAIDAKDKDTHGHSRRMQKYARAIAQSMHLAADQVEAVAAAALLHDIGKLAIPEYILGKRSALTPEEVRKLRMHPQFGADIISTIKFPFPIADAVLAHHERYDGHGYPRGLAGKDIPLSARIIAVADVFDGYISDRIESNETLHGAVREIREGCGAAFDPEIVAVWEKIYRDVVVWPSNAESASHTGIQQARSELDMLESLALSIEGMTSVQDIFFTVRSRLMKCVPSCTVTIEIGERDGVPVVFGGKAIATVTVRRQDEAAINEEELRLVHAVAAKIAPMVHNAMAIEEARREATLDKLTGLPNRRAFEMLSASLNRQHFSIVLIDLNSFKAVNDNFGHNAGDATLIRIAAHLRAAFHDARLTCRLGGDEFLVLSFAGVRALRSQIRRFRQMVVWDPAHDAYRQLRFGVSCGLASIPRDAENIEQAMQCADERMYAIKTRLKGGRDSAVVAMQRKSTRHAVRLREFNRPSLAAKK
jgi:diguanylate cyclase (GGDEF)-like protein/putative nucleotidyltransferase with HDIG domain